MRSTPAPRIRLAATAALLLGSLAFLASSSTGKSPTPALELHVTAQDDGGQFWFEVEGFAGRNPDIRVAAGQEVHIHFTNNGTVAHNFQVGDGATALGGVACCLPAGHHAAAEAEGSFTAPTHDAQLAYYCEPHRELNMAGHILVGDGSPRTAPAPAAAWLALGLLGLASLARRVEA